MPGVIGQKGGDRVSELDSDADVSREIRRERRPQNGNTFEWETTI
jgi:hypothetical protein